MKHPSPIYKGNLGKKKGGFRDFPMEELKEGNREMEFGC